MRWIFAERPHAHQLPNRRPTQKLQKPFCLSTINRLPISLRYDQYIHVSVNTIHKKHPLFINIFQLVNITSRDYYNDSRPSSRRYQFFNNKNKYIKHNKILIHLIYLIIQNFNTWNRNLFLIKQHRPTLNLLTDFKFFDLLQ